MAAVSLTQLSPHVVRLGVPTPTLPPAFETNTYLVFSKGHGLIIDAGTTDLLLLQEVTKQAENFGIEHVSLMATHYHRDHTQGLPWLQARYGSPIYLHPLDIPPLLTELKRSDVIVEPAPEELQVGDVRVVLTHSPGHTHGHLHVRIYPDQVVLVGDSLAGTGSVWIGPPDGHLGPYYTSLDALIAGDCTVAGPGHGNEIEDVHKAAELQKRHRQDRGRQILSHLADWSSIDDLVNAIYRDDVPIQALPFAKKTIQANLQYFLSANHIEQQFDDTRFCTVYRLLGR